MRYLLDTNICIDVIRGRDATMLTRLQSPAVEEVGISVITLAELEHGVARSQRPAQNRAALYQFCVPLTIFPFDTESACHYGDIRATLERQGQRIGPMDLLIAAHARALGAILITNNDREFRRVAGLRVEQFPIAPQ